MQLQARFYGSTSPNPVTKKVTTQSNEHGRSPRLDLILSQHTLQPHIHDVVVSVRHRGKDYLFHIFFKKHKSLRKNNVIRVMKAKSWRGDILVMKKGRAELVNMPASHANLADYAVKR